ncbi:bacteriohemerythrin [Campylobacter jejuni]|uniref:bacteriohemerythrin n=1 Tax=Campylobacter jejuni TaxID=197 RepID=UPI003BA801D2
MDKLIPLWSEKYSINNEIDIQHQKLFELGIKVENAVFKFVKREELKEILIELFYYMKEHFHDEENYMNEIKYPYLNEHKTMHKVIIRNMSHLIKNIKTTNDLKEKLYIIISEWLLEHILHHDIMIKHWKENNDNAVQNLENNDNAVQNLENNDNAVQNLENKIEFIYSCPCKTTHILSYNEHLSILYRNKILKCKNCKKNLFYLKNLV